MFYLAINSREPFHQTLIRSPNFNPCTLLPSEKAVRLVSISWAHSSVTHSLLIMYDNVFGRKVLERQPNNWHYSVILWDIHQSSRTVRDPINRRVHLIGNHSMWPLIDHLLMTMLDTWIKISSRDPFQQTLGHSLCFNTCTTNVPSPLLFEYFNENYLFRSLKGLSVADQRHLFVFMVVSWQRINWQGPSRIPLDRLVIWSSCTKHIIEPCKRCFPL